mmetsp:Transcript_20643/g.43793  ORF Transcript_20643/g.43793 Transcript_20643/m.43793 type:complete len:336 (+) Transcript_20643:52-1059(+)
MCISITINNFLAIYCIPNDAHKFYLFQKEHGASFVAAAVIVFQCDVIDLICGGFLHCPITTADCVTTSTITSSINMNIRGSSIHGSASISSSKIILGKFLQQHSRLREESLPIALYQFFFRRQVGPPCRQFAFQGRQIFPKLPNAIPGVFVVFVHSVEAIEGPRGGNFRYLRQVLVFFGDNGTGGEKIPIQQPTDEVRHKLGIANGGIVVGVITRRFHFHNLAPGSFKNLQVPVAAGDVGYPGSFVDHLPVFPDEAGIGRTHTHRGSRCHDGGSCCVVVLVIVCVILGLVFFSREHSEKWIRHQDVNVGIICKRLQKNGFGTIVEWTDVHHELSP